MLVAELNGGLAVETATEAVTWLNGIVWGVPMLVLILGYYYSTAARNNLTPFIRATVYGRFSVLLFFIAFVALGWAPAILILFGVIDAAAAVWTAVSLRNLGSLNSQP